MIGYELVTILFQKSYELLPSPREVQSGKALPLSARSTPPDESPFAIAGRWTSRILTVCLEMVLPGLVGFWLDRRWEITPWLTVVGFTLGLVMAMWHLLQMTSSESRDERRRRE